MNIPSSDIQIRRRRPLFLGLRRRAFRALPFVAWTGILVLILGYQQSGTAMAEVRGLASANRHRITAPVAGMIDLVSVSDHEAVRAGQIVAALSDDELRLRLARARIDLEILRAELAREESRVGLDRTIGQVERADDRAVDLRRFHRDVEGAAIDVLTTRAEIEETIVRRHGIGIELHRTRDLVVRGVAPPSQETDLETDYDALGVRIEELQRILVAREDRVRTTRARLAGGETALLVDPIVDADALLGPFHWRIRAQQVELETLALLRDQITLRTPIEGRVEDVFFRPGERIAAGDVLAVVVDERVRSVVAYVPETMRGELGEQPRFEVADPRTPHHFVPTTVESIAPAVTKTPRRLWRDPQTEEWSVPVRLVAQEGVTPGQTVIVRWRR